MPGSDCRRVLVLAPRFPSVNQPWMDRYLQGLHDHGLSFAIATYNQGPYTFTTKARRIGAGMHLLVVPNDRRTIVLSLLAFVFRSPLQALRLLVSFDEAGSSSGARKKLSRAIAGLVSLACLERAGSPAVVHTHSEAMASRFLPALALRRLPLVVTFHGLQPTGVPPVERQDRDQISQYASCVLVNTEFARRHANDLGYATSKLEVVPQGIDLDEFPARRGRPRRAKDLIKVLSVGRLHREKGHAYALLAMARLLAQGVDIHWTFVGDGPERRALERLASALELRGRVAFLGGLRFEELLPVYYRHDLFVLAALGPRRADSWAETQGVVLQEAQATGCIPIATRVGGITECIRHGRDGYLIPDRSHRAITDAINYFIERPECWEAFRREGRRNVEERFSSEVVAQKLSRILLYAMREGNSESY